MAAPPAGSFRRRRWWLLVLLAVALVAAGLGWRAWRGGPPSALKIALAGPDSPLSASVAREVGLVLPGSLRADLSVAAPGGGAAMWTGSFQRSEAETADLPREAASSLAPVVRSERLDADTLRAFLSTCARLTEMPDEATARLLRTVVERRPDFALARAELAYAEAYLAYPGVGFSPEQPRLRDSARRHCGARSLTRSRRLHLAEHALIERSDRSSRFRVLEEGLRLAPDDPRLRRIRTSALDGWQNG